MGDLWDHIIANSVQIQVFNCPVCHKKLDSVMSPQDGSPRPKVGDLSMCMSCMAIGAFLEDGSLRVATTEECERLPAWVKDVIAFHAALHAVRDVQ